MFGKTRLILSAGCALLGACSSPRHTIEQQTEALVTVQAIDVPNRLVSVIGPRGDEFTFYVDESVRAFPQAKVGDQVRVRYYESLALEMRKPGDKGPQMQVEEETSRPQPGQPSGTARIKTQATVRIEAIDRKGNTVTYTGPRGTRTLYVTDPALRDYVKKLRPGDQVEATFTEALAVSLEPASK